MKLLLVTYSFPPAAGVGVLRAFSLARYLPEAGVQVEVLTARNAAAVGRDDTLLPLLSPGVGITRTWTPDLPFALRKAIKRAVSGRGRSPATGSKAAAVPEPAARSGLLKRLVANLLLPDPQAGWVPFASRAARRIIRAGAVDAVLVTVPPFSSVRVVTRLRRVFPALPIVLDFRDEWLTTTLDLVSFNNNPRARAVASRAESDAVRDASLVVCVTDAAVEELRRRYPAQPPSKFQCVPNGFDRALVKRPLPRPVPAGEPVVLTYIGTVYGSTDPTPVVEAILALPPELRARLRLRFIGHIETALYRETLLRLGSQIELIDFLPQAEALRYIETTTYLLLITHDPINVAAKLYDYLGSGVPILAAVHPTGDVRRILERTQAGWAADSGDPAALRRLLAEAVQRAPDLGQAFQPRLEIIGGYHRRPLAARYAALLRHLVQEHTHLSGTEGKGNGQPA